MQPTSKGTPPNQQNLTTNTAAAPSNPGTSPATAPGSSPAMNKTSAMTQVTTSTSGGAMLANPQSTASPQAAANGTPPAPVSLSTTQAPPSRPATPSPLTVPLNQKKQKQLDNLLKSASVKLTDEQTKRLGENRSLKSIGLDQMKQLLHILGEDGADSAKLRCVPDSNASMGFRIEKIEASDSSFKQKVMTQDEKGETYVGLMSIFDNQTVSGNTKFEEITLDKVTSTIMDLERKIALGEYITGADLHDTVSLIVEDMSSVPLAAPSKPADFSHMELKDMAELTTLLKSARNPDAEVIAHPDPAALSRFGIKVTSKKKAKTANGASTALNSLKVCIEDRTRNQTVTTLKNILSRWENDRRISDDTRTKISSAKRELDKKVANSTNITIADIHGVFYSITKDLKKH